MIRLRGGWYCEHCKKVHSRRTYRYSAYTIRMPWDGDKPPAIHLNTKFRPGPTTDRNVSDGQWVCSVGRDAILQRVDEQATQTN